MSGRRDRPAAPRFRSPPCTGSPAAPSSRSSRTSRRAAPSGPPSTSPRASPPPARARSSPRKGGRLVGELQAKGGIWVPFPAATKNPPAMLLNVRRLARICHDEGVGVVHARSRAPAWVALGAARALDLPFVTTYHGSYSGRSKIKVLYNSVMARGDVVIANSALHRRPRPQRLSPCRRAHPGHPPRHRFSAFSPRR